MKQLFKAILIIFVLFWGLSCSSSPETVEQDDPLALEDPEEAFEGIAAFVSLGDPVAAIEAFEAAQLEDPDDPDTQVLYSNLLLLGGKLAEADALLEGLIDEDPNNIDAIFALSVSAALAGDEERQKGLLEDLVAKNPDHALAQASLGELYLKEDNLVDAELALRTSVSIEDNVPARIALGNVYLQSEKLDLAKTEIEAAISLDDEYSFAFSDLARVNVAMSEFEIAEGNLDDAIELLPDHFWHYLDRGRIRSRQNKIEEALSDFNKAIELDPNIFISYVYRGQIHALLEDFEEAKKDLEVALEKRPDYFPAYGSIGLVELKLRNYEEAAFWFDKLSDGVQLNPSYFLLSLFSKIQSGAYDSNQNLINQEINRLARDEIHYKIARYYINPGYDGGILLDVQQIDDLALQKSAYAFLGIMFYEEGKVNSSYAMFQNAIEPPLENSPEIIMARWLLNEFDIQE
jgi:tetratricopeptide (TPR) repeat protein